MKPTLDQAGKVLELLSQSGRTDEWVQHHLLGSGAFSDLLAVDNLRDMDRDKRRRFFGLNPSDPPLLEDIGTVNTSATTDTLVVSDEFAAGKNGISYVGENFKRWFYPKVEAPSADATLRYARLTRASLDEPIRKEIGVANEETTLGQILALIRRRKNSKGGVLLTDGRANIFYIRDAYGTIRAVYVGWGGGGWGVYAYSVSDSSGWAGGHRVFSRNSWGAVTV